MAIKNAIVADIISFALKLMLIVLFILMYTPYLDLKSSKWWVALEEGRATVAYVHKRFIAPEVWRDR